MKQGVRGALRAKNLRVLLQAVSAPEDLAMAAEVPLERLQNMAEGALCSDETAYHLEQQLRLPSGWLDRHNTEVPPNVRQLLLNPEQALLEEDLPTVATPEPAPVRPSVQTPVLASEETPAPVSKSIESAAEDRQPGLPLDFHQPSTHLPTPAVAEDSVAPSVSVAVSGSVPAADISAIHHSEDTMSPNDLRRQNLHVLLEGKGAKSALARLISLSPASVTSMLNGAKALDKEFCASLCLALKLPENWFESERTSSDVPEAVKKRLAPLPRGAATPAPALNKTGMTAPVSEPAAAPTPAPAPAEAAPSEGLPKTWPASTSKVSKVLRLGGTGVAPAPASVTPPAAPTPPVPAASLPLQDSPVATEVSTAPPPAQHTRPLRALAPEHAGDAPIAPASGFIIEGGLSPITEALIKTLAQKARQGALSEDRAFELLGTVRSL